MPPKWDSSPQEGVRRRLSPRAAAAPDATPAPGETLLLGRYQLLERLGSGGFGVVWRARDELLHREVAVKRIPLTPEGDSERATREALATARLAHPAIVALYEATSDDEAFYLISELVHGVTLSRLIAAQTLTDRQVLAIGVALSGALSHAHARGVIHRDVKPQNVLIPRRPDGQSPAPGAPHAVAKLTDFGGASLSDQEALTRTGDVLGTLAYMAPEQCEGREVGAPADLYALALVLYEALSGVNPVRGPTPAATARRIGRPIAALRRSRRDLPRALTHALDTALSPAPEQRGTVDELRGTLEESLQRGLGRRSHGRAEAHARPEREPVEQPPQIDSEPALQESRPVAGGRATLPRGLWLGLAIAAIVWQIGAGRSGVALLALAAAVPLLALPRRTGPGWLASALAPGLGLAGLAGAFPAIAGQAPRWRQRAALAALGFWWLTLAEPLLGRQLWLGPHAGTPARATWEGSITGAAHALAPLLSVGVLLGAALWAAGAIVLPWIIRGRSAALDVVAATMWSAALASAAPLAGAGLSSHAVHSSPRGAVLGAILGGAIAVAARALRGPI